MGAASLAAMGFELPVMAGPFDNPNFDKNVPADKKLDHTWVKALFERGTPEVFSHAQLDTVKMPIGGICTGHVYLSGEGKMIDWLFGKNRVELAQGFTLRTVVDGKTDTHPLEKGSFPDMTFRGEYPIAKIDYVNATVPVEVSAEIFSPFIPLNAEDSGIPATIFSFRLKNTSDKPVEATLAGNLENAAYYVRRFGLTGKRRNQIVSANGMTILNCTGELIGVDPGATPQPDIIFEDWPKETFEGWTVEGTGFGSGPYARDVVEKRFGPDFGGESPRLVNSFLAQGDQGTGKLTSKPFPISRRFIKTWIGGGDAEGQVGINVVVDGKVVQTATGPHQDKLVPCYLDLQEFAGKQATIEIFDNSQSGWSQIGVGRITFTDLPPGVPDVVFEDWDKDTFDGWTVEGDAFGTGPIKREAIQKDMGDIGGESPRVVNSFFPTHTDTAKGKLTSAPFTIKQRYIKIWVGGGDLKDKVGVNLVIDGKVVQSETGKHDNRLTMRLFDVGAYLGKQAIIEIFDNSDEAWAQIGVGRIAFSDSSLDPGPSNNVDEGSMALALLGPPAELTLAKGQIGMGGDSSTDADVPITKKLIGTLGRTVTLKPGESAQVNFVVAWYFPNLSLDGLKDKGRYYANRFDSAKAVATYVGANFDKLAFATRIWNSTWYDSTLPYWFLDRTFIPAATLATSGCMRFKDGRFWAWEGGADCCAGTCTHVWQYAHTMGRIFPELERDTRERVDLGISLHKDTGVSGFRGEFDMSLAVDGQTGTILRIYREHQMTPDNTFLKKNWDNIKLMYLPLFALDPKEEGIMDGMQMNTLDRPWFGQISWMSSMYAAACRAGEMMAKEVGDTEFAAKCGKIADNGYKNIGTRLFNGEYFFSTIDPNHVHDVSSGQGSLMDQVYGQSWGFQLGLPRILPEAETKTALKSLWTYNFSPDAGSFFADKHMGRKFVSIGDAGMIMCTFPRTDWNFAQASGGDPEKGGFAYYFVECWTGNEYQVAAHMFWEDMLLEPLAMVRAIHDRYNPLKRNPYSEEECGQHYSRAMASHAAFIGACGYKYHGPKGEIGFAPKLKPEDFRAPFTAAEGWGTYSQKIAAGKMVSNLELKHGKLRLRTISLVLDGHHGEPTAKVNLNGSTVPAKCSVVDGHIVVQFESDVVIPEGQRLTLEIA
jgi:uncharacterized protein (DUF608 family)